MWTKTQIKRKLKSTLKKGRVEPTDRPFVIKLTPPTDSENLYWNTEGAWVPRSQATVFTYKVPDLSIGHKVYLDEEKPDTQN